MNQFFREHPILKEKVRNIRWPAAAQVVVEVADFPVEQMPPFAKAKFEGRVRELQQTLGDPIAIDIVEIGTNRVLLRFDAPAASPSAARP
ncbi:MAG: hypothetical protein IT290_06225 [Deltaproteobacteria bacterium]|nr:hypothetical protein [Deltaproteobacteria bacterium]